MRATLAPAASQSSHRVCRRDEPHMTARSEARSADDHRAWHGVVRRVVRRSRESAACRHCWSSSCSTTSSRASSLPLCSPGVGDVTTSPGQGRWVLWQVPGASCGSARRPCGHCPSTIQTPDPSWLPAGSATLRGTSFISVRTVSCRAGGLSGVWSWTSYWPSCCYSPGDVLPSIRDWSPHARSASFTRARENRNRDAKRAGRHVDDARATTHQAPPPFRAGCDDLRRSRARAASRKLRPLAEALDQGSLTALPRHTNGE